MKTEKDIEIELTQFLKLVEQETCDARTAYEQSKRAYEDSLRGFVLRNITGEKFYEVAHREAFDDAYQLVNQSPASDFVDELITLNFIVDRHQSWIEEGQLYEEQEFIL